MDHSLGGYFSKNFEVCCVERLCVMCETMRRGRCGKLTSCSDASGLRGPGKLGRLTPKSSTLALPTLNLTHLRPSTLDRDPQPSTLEPRPSTLNPHPSTFNPQTSTLNPRPSTIKSQPSTLDRQLSTLVPQPSNLKPQPWTLDPQPSTLDPQPSTLDP